MSEQSDIQSRLNQQDESLGNDDPGAGGGAEDIVNALADGGDGGLVFTEERKPINRSTIITFVVLVLGAGGVWFMYQRAGGPNAAMASKETLQAKETINEFLSGGEANIKLMETMLRNTQKVVQQFLNYPSMTQVPLSELKSNPFRLNDDGPQRPDTEAEAKKKREAERLAALEAVQRLQLQSIMYGERRRACMINGALYVEGQEVEIFSIEKINPQSVVVKSGPYRFELRMQR